MPAALTAGAYKKALDRHRSKAELQRLQRHLRSDQEGAGSADRFLGVRMGEVFALSKEFSQLPPREIEKLLQSRYHEVRAGGLKIMALQAAARKTPDARRKELFELYLRRTDRIDNWDLVDVAAPDAIGRYLIDKPREVLYSLARSPDPWERRTAIVSTLFLVRQGDVDDTFRIAELLVSDDHDLVQKATGGVLREAGEQDRGGLLAFLDKHSETMSRTALRYATERLDAKRRAKYLRTGRVAPGGRSRARREGGTR